VARSLSLTIVLASLALLQGCLCSDEVVRKLPSPDGLLVATQYVRKCGPVADHDTRVNLRVSREGFDSNEGVVFSVKGEQPIVFEWDGSKHLIIHCKECTRDAIHREVVRFGNVDIDFELRDSGTVPTTPAPQ
jgi:hypothetical protein